MDKKFDYKKKIVNDFGIRLNLKKIYNCLKYYLYFSGNNKIKFQIVENPDKKIIIFE